MKNNDIIYKSSFLRGDELTKGDKTTNGSPIGFTPIDCEADWLDADKLYSVWKIIYNLGGFSIETFSNKLAVTFRLSEDSNIVFRFYEDKFVIGECSKLSFITGDMYIFQLENGLNIEWQKKVTSLKINDFIKEVYEAFKTDDNNLLFKEHSSPKLVAINLFSVDSIFSSNFIFGPCSSDLMDEDILSSFDKPKLLSIINISNYKFIALKVRKDEGEKYLKYQFEELKKKEIADCDLDELFIEHLMGNL